MVAHKQRSIFDNKILINILIEKWWIYFYNLEFKYTMENKDGNWFNGVL